MSDVKAKRTARESVQRETTAAPIAETPRQDIAPIPAIAMAPPALPKSVLKTGMATSDDVFAHGQQVWAALAETQAAAARGLEALIGEMTTFTRSEIAAAADSATAMLGVKTFAEAVEVNLGYARRSFDALIGSSAKLSEIGAKAASEASRPILSRFGESWKTSRPS